MSDRLRNHFALTATQAEDLLARCEECGAAHLWNPVDGYTVIQAFHCERCQVAQDRYATHRDGQVPSDTVHTLPVPREVLALAADWHGGQSSSLYAVASTGELSWNRGRVMSEERKARVLADLWLGLWIELADPVNAGELAEEVRDEVGAIADLMTDQHERIYGEVLA